MQESRARGEPENVPTGSHRVGQAVFHAGIPIGLDVRLFIMLFNC